MVTIRAVQGDGIIQHAKNATQKYSKAQIEETIGILQYQALLDSNGASSALTLDQINEQEWITNGSASAVQNETTGDITITIPTTGETIVVPGKITESTDSIVGKYYLLGSTEFYFEIKENGEFETYMGSGGTSIGTYTYDSTSKIISATAFGETMKINYILLEKNKVIYWITGESGYVFSSNGTEGFEIPADGKYTGTYDNIEYEIIVSSGNMVINSYMDGEIGSIIFDGSVIVKDEIILGIYVERSVENIFKVSGDNLIGYGFADGTIFTKVTE